MKKAKSIWINTNLTGTAIYFLVKILGGEHNFLGELIFGALVHSIIVGLLCSIVSAPALIWFTIVEKLNNHTTEFVKTTLIFVALVLSIFLSYYPLMMFLDMGVFPRLAYAELRNPYFTPILYTYGISGIIWTVLMYWDRVIKRKTVVNTNV